MFLLEQGQVRVSFANWNIKQELVKYWLVKTETIKMGGGAVFISSYIRIYFRSVWPHSSCLSVWSSQAEHCWAWPLPSDPSQWLETQPNGPAPFLREEGWTEKLAPETEKSSRSVLSHLCWPTTIAPHQGRPRSTCMCSSRFWIRPTGV